MEKNNQTQKNPNPKEQGAGDHRNDTRKHQYKEHDQVLTNDENYDADTKKFKGEEPELDDKLNNEEKK